MLEKLNKAKSHLIVAVIAMTTGVVCTSILTPQKTVTKTVTVEKVVTKEVEKIVNKVVYVDKVVTKNVYKDRVIERKITRKDGTIEETKIVDRGSETNTSDTVSKVTIAEKEKIKEKIDETTISKSVSEPAFKRFQVSALLPVFPTAVPTSTFVLVGVQPFEFIPITIEVGNAVNKINPFVGIGVKF